MDSSFQGRDAFELLSMLAGDTLSQSLSLYYPVEFAMNNPSLVEDKHRLIRSRKVHIAGITLPENKDITDEMLDFAVNYCGENMLQLSVKVSDDDDAGDLISALMTAPNWLEDLNIPNIRVHRGTSGFSPFVKIKEELQQEVATRALKEDEEIYGLDDYVIGYTKLASDYIGFVDIGELRIGAKANFLILDKDMARIAVEDIDTVHPAITVIDGKTVYQA